jgi:predicted nuclease of restriction endonuclease-like (RecB) superfamily
MDRSYGLSVEHLFCKRKALSSEPGSTKKEKKKTDDKKPKFLVKQELCVSSFQSFQQCFKLDVT